MALSKLISIFKAPAVSNGILFGSGVAILTGPQPPDSPIAAGSNTAGAKPGTLYLCSGPGSIQRAYVLGGTANWQPLTGGSGLLEAPADEGEPVYEKPTVTKLHPPEAKDEPKKDDEPKPKPKGKDKD